VAHCLAKSGKGSPTLEVDNRYQIDGHVLPNSQALAMQLMQTYLIGVEPDGGVFMAYDVRNPLEVNHFSVQAERSVLCCFLKMDLTDHVILSTKTREQNFRNWKRRMEEQTK
jgi:hypothetical protein